MSEASGAIILAGNSNSNIRHHSWPQRFWGHKWCLKTRFARLHFRLTAVQVSLAGMCSTSVVLYAEIYASFRVIHFHKRLRLFSSVMRLRMVGMIRRAFDTDFWAAIIKCTRLLGSSHPDLISSRLLKVFDPTVLVYLANAFPHINPLSTCMLVLVINAHFIISQQK